MMSNMNNRLWVNGGVHSAQPCERCDAMAQRDVQILATLQTLNRVFDGTDGIKNPRIKLARAKRAFDELLRLMQPETW